MATANAAMLTGHNDQAVGRRKDGYARAEARQGLASWSPVVQ